LKRERSSQNRKEGMSMKMFKMSAVVLVTALLFPSSTFASSWNYLGKETLYSKGAESHQYPSTGGDYRICRDSSGSDKIMKVELWEYDLDNWNDWVGTRYLEPGECGVFREIGDMVDGGDEAEFFAKSGTSGQIHLYFYD
jgi:hypothetical protein